MLVQGCICFRSGMFDSVWADAPEINDEANHGVAVIASPQRKMRAPWGFSRHLRHKLSREVLNNKIKDKQLASFQTSVQQPFAEKVAGIAFGNDDSVGTRSVITGEGCAASISQARCLDESSVRASRCLVACSGTARIVCGFIQTFGWQHSSFIE